MKKLMLSPVLIGLVLTASCSKTPTNTTPTTPATTTPTIPTDGWMLKGIKYKQITTTRQESQFNVNAIDATTKPNTFGVFFKAYPTASGTYKIVALVPDSTKPYPNQHVAADEVIIVATLANTTGNNTSYYSMGYDGKLATVTLTNGKIKLEVPEISVTSGNTDTLKLSGTVLEN